MIKKLVRLAMSINISYSTNILKETDILLFCHDNNYSLKLKNKAYSPLMDSLREDVEMRGWKTQTIGQPFSRIADDSAWSSPVLINKSYLIAKIKDTTIQLISIFLKKKYTSTFNLYRKILKQSKPICVIGIGLGPELCYAAKKEKILCIELLHGIGYDPLPWGWSNMDKEYLPNCILSLDQKSTKTFSELSSKEIKIIQIPHPFLKRFSLEKYQDALPIEWKQQLASKQSKKTILITLQWGYDTPPFEGILENHIIHDKLTKAVQAVHTKDIIWAFRLHPVQVKEKRYKHHLDYIKDFCENHINTQWQWFTEMPLPVVLKQCSGHITMSSMSSYEAAYMGVKTLALCPTLQQGGRYQNMFSDLEETGYLKKSPANTEEIIEWVKGIEPVPPFIDNLADEEAWENALEWMLGSRYKYNKEIA